MAYHDPFHGDVSDDCDVHASSSSYFQSQIQSLKKQYLPVPALMCAGGEWRQNDGEAGGDGDARPLMLSPNPQLMREQAQMIHLKNKLNKLVTILNKNVIFKLK